MKHTLLLFFFISTFTLFSQNKNQSIGFKENKGQIMDQKGKPNTAVKYLLNSNGLNVQLKKNGFSYDIYEVKKIPVSPSKTSKTVPYQIPEKDKDKEPEYSLEYKFHRVDIDFVNSNSKVALITDQESKDFDNYYNVPNKPEGIVGVHQYKQITYQNIYPNIDVVFTVPEDPTKVVEYNFVIHPKGKISDIQLKFNGAETALVDNKIQMNVRFGKMEETLPASWVEENTCKKEIAVGYRKIKKDVYGFDTSDAVDGKTVVIDPVPTRLWGTFYGDEEDYGSNEFGGMTTDLLGNNYLVGSTAVPNSSYATSGAHQTTIGNPNKMAPDGIIVKFSSDGRKIWSSYYGGEEYDRIKAVKTDYQNNVIIVGQTNSKTNISTAGSNSPSFGGYDDGFLVKFNSSGVRLWGTYYGGKDNDAAYDVDIDKNNNIFMVGRFSINRSENVHNTPIGDGFVAKFNSNGNILWNKLYGGKGADEFRTIKVGENFLVVGGLTNSTDNISTPGVFQENLSITNGPDGIVLKLNLDGTRIWSSYYGGEHSEIIHAVEFDDEDNIYIGGTTPSSTGIATPGSFDDYNLNSETGFFAKLNQNGQRVWGSYLGSSTKVYSFVFKNNSLYIGGNGGIDNSITTLCAYKRTGFSGGYIGKFSKMGELLWGSYTGGFDQYSETAITIKNNEIVVGGTSLSKDGITDSNSYQPEILGRKNFYLIKFSEENNCNIDANPKKANDYPICIGGVLNFKAEPGYNYLWTGPNGFTSTLQNPSITNVSYTNNGNYHLKASDNCGCEKTYDIYVSIGDSSVPAPDITTLPTITGYCNTTITTIPTATDNCSGRVIGTTTDPLSYTIPGTYTIIWSYYDETGNGRHQKQTIIISSPPLPTSNSPQTFCLQQNATLGNIAITGQNIKWYNHQTAGSLLPETTLLQNSLIYYASQAINGCESARIPVTVNIQNTLPPSGNANQPFCSAQNPTIANIQITGTQIKWYDALNNGSLLTQTTNLQNGQRYYASQTVNGCESERLEVTISIVNTPSAPIINGNTEFCKSENATLNNIQIAGQNIKWYDTNIAAATLPNKTLLENNRTYYASQTVGCESDRTAISVKVYDTALPTGNRNQQFCIDQNATIANLNITGTALKWYDSATNRNILTQTTSLQNKAYYVTQTLNNCESERLAVNVKIQDTPIPIADSPQTFCIQKNAKISNIDIEGQNIQWFESISSSVSLSESTLLENGITYYASQTVNNCESERIPVLINILGAITADCINFTEELPYPKFFTPNNDYHNDTWTIDFAYLKPNTGIRIFDRYGKLLKELRPNSEWDGTYTGQDMPASDYWFTVTRLNGTEYRGHFSLKR